MNSGLLMMSTITGKLKGKKAIRLLQMHRLIAFQKVFDAFLEGKLPAAVVITRAKKMREIGLPKLK